VTVYAASTYSFYLYNSYTRALAESATLVVPDDVSSKFDEHSLTYDAEVGRGETLIGLVRLRKKLVSSACGHVLELSVGTGRNAEYLPLTGRNRIASYTAVDKSGPMVAIAREKFASYTVARDIKVQFLAQDAVAKPLRLPASAAVAGKGTVPKYDTVIDTFGLCSTPDPVRLLENAARVLEPTKGRILLLEHGRAHYAWLNRILDGLANSHALNWGCWWNRDIGKLVEEACERAGLEVVVMKRRHLGTTWWVELRMKAMK
jgi:methyltransferase OMS1